MTETVAVMPSSADPSDPSQAAVASLGDDAAVAETDRNDRTVALVAEWLDRAAAIETGADRRTLERLQGVISDPDGVAFAMQFVDRVIRPEDVRTAAHQLAGLVDERALPGFLSPLDRLLLRAGGRLAPLLPGIVIPLASRRMRQLVGHLVVDAEPKAMATHLGAQRAEGFRLNVNLLGEAVLGDAEADRRFEAAMALLEQPDVDYVSVKVSAVVSQLNHWAFDDSVDRVVERLRVLFAKAAATSPPTFVNLDMEEYHDLELTKDAFMRVLAEPAFHGVEAGIVLQAYLPDSFAALQELVAWASSRRSRVVDGRPGADIKIRLVKGANLAMEKVESAIHGWEEAPYRTKAETDANYKRCLDWVLTPERTAAVRIGLASHNLFDVAWGHLLSEERGVSDRLEFEMLQGMAPAQARVVRDDGDGLLLYTPVVAPTDFDVAISYLFRRLEENASDENFIRHLFSLRPGNAAFESEAAKFRAAVADRFEVGSDPQRTQNRQIDGGGRVSSDGVAPRGEFVNEPDTDPALPANRAWAREVMARPAEAPNAPITERTDLIDEAVRSANQAQVAWREKTGSERQAILHAAADELGRRRGDLIAAMVHEANKTFGQADPEVSEAVDFARWYGDRAVDLERPTSAAFEPLGVIAVVPPWNFPVAIPAGGVLAALAAGNGVIFKPAPETPRCAEIVAECCWAAGVPTDLLRFVRAPDDEVGRHLITHDGVAAVILTGAYETAALFRSWKPELRIFGETSGKNALIITPNADIDLAVADLVESAFGHSGQKCSAASLAICVGDLYESPRFRRQLIDAVASIQVGPSLDLETTMGPTIHEPEGKLLRALTELDDDESWLVTPRRIGVGLWTPGVRLGVQNGSWFHGTECFGPVLGIMKAADLDEAIEFQNATSFGLTGGIHTLDPNEVDRWEDEVEIGNAYVNRQITGAIVQRQPFGGWKRSTIGPGAKAGGPNYIAQLGTWRPTDLDLDEAAWLEKSADSDRAQWIAEFGAEHDATGLFCEANTFRYRPLPKVVVRVEAGGAERDVVRVRQAAEQVGVPVEISHHETESTEAFASRLGSLKLERVRVLGTVPPELRAAAIAAGVHVADDPVTSDGRIELLHYLREQAVSRTLHRYGNVL